MGRSRTRRVAVAEGLARALGWQHVHVVEELRGEGTQLERLRARVAGVSARGGHVVYSSPPLPGDECRRLRQDGVQLVRLKHGDEDADRLAGVLTLDGDMPAEALVATIRAVLRI